MSGIFSCFSSAERTASLLRGRMQIFAYIVLCNLLGFTMAIPSSIGDLADKVQSGPVDASNLAEFIRVNKCIGDLGCFDNGPPFYDKKWRPISLPPTEILLTKFWLFTPGNKEDQEYLDLTSDSIRRSSFKRNLPVKVLIHGFLDQLYPGHKLLKLKDALLKKGTFNVIMVDWSKNNLMPYEQAVANTRVVGAQVAKMVNKIMKVKGLAAKAFHLIGHSLGAHVAGYAGKRIDNLGRITGLDPAGPQFGCDNKEVRLSHTDAEFVDAIHTNGGDCIMSGFGMFDPVAHLDFYPNGGESQPGCESVIEPMYDEFKKIFNDSSRMNACDHDRAVYYFMESINSGCRFQSYLCNNYTSIKNGNCPPEKTMSPMGFHAEKIPNLPEKSMFYLRTSDGSVDKRFCIRQNGKFKQPQ